MAKKTKKTEDLCFLSDRKTEVKTRLTKKTKDVKNPMYDTTGAARDGDLSVKEGWAGWDVLVKHTTGWEVFVKNMGWEVFVNNTTGQKWWKVSSASSVMGDGSLRATVEIAEQPDCRHDGEQDETDEEPQAPEKKRRRTGKTTNASKVVREWHKEP